MTGEGWVIDASPLILLGKMQRLESLEALTASVAVPECVLAEVASGHGQDATTAATLAWAEARKVPDLRVPVIVTNWDLGPGESQVIAHALAEALIPVLDDGEARACALSLSLPMIGTLGIKSRLPLTSPRGLQRR
ncbi:MAG: DUF3368 domain-containing protein [bacterium]